MGRRIHNNTSLGLCRVLWARAKANHLSGPQEQQVNLILKNGSGSHTRQIWTSSPGRVYYPFWGSENLWTTALLRNKATFWDGEGTLQAEQECHLLCAQAARGSNSSSSNKAVSLEPDRFCTRQTQLSKHKQMSQSMAWISTSHKRLSKSHNQLLPSPIILQQGKLVIEMHIYLQRNGSRHHSFHVSVKQFVPSMLGLLFVWLALIK